MSKITKTLGGDRLGSGNSMKVKLHNFERATFNQSRKWLSTANVGTLIPCFKEIYTNGDKMEMDINAIIRTMPTVGPLFGSFKAQIDMFAIPLRVYVGYLHNNTLNVGTKMEQIKFPKMVFTNIKGINEVTKTARSSLLRYLGYSSTAVNKSKNNEEKLNAIPYLAYWDIFKNYYANKQEKNAYYLTTSENRNEISGLSYTLTNGNQQIAIINENTTDEELTKISEKLKSLQTEGINKIEIHENTYIPNVKPLSIPEKANPMPIDYTKITDWYTQRKYVINNVLIADQEYLTNMRNGAKTTTPQLNLNSFPLDNIDKKRNEILKNSEIGREIEINRAPTYPPYENTTVNSTVEQGLLAVKTYQSDLFNNWLSKDYAANIDYISNVTAATITDGTLKMDVLNIAQKVYNMLNRIAVSGSSWEDWQEAVYSEVPIKRAENPYFIGGWSGEVAFEEVVSTTGYESEGNSNALGTLGGKGITVNKKGGNIVMNFDEPTIVMGIFSLTPRITYSQGNNFILELKSMDDLHKPSMDGIGYQELITRRMVGSDAEINNNVITLKSIGKQPAWINYMTAIDECFGEFGDGGSQEWMTLNRKYSGSDFTTYIDPKLYNNIFAVTDINAQNFWVNIGFKVKSRRKMSAKQIPNL